MAGNKLRIRTSDERVEQALRYAVARHGLVTQINSSTPPPHFAAASVGRSELASHLQFRCHIYILVINILILQLQDYGPLGIESPTHLCSSL